VKDKSRLSSYPSDFAGAAAAAFKFDVAVRKLKITGNCTLKISGARRPRVPAPGPARGPHIIESRRRRRRPGLQLAAVAAGTAYNEQRFVELKVTSSRLGLAATPVRVPGRVLGRVPGRPGGPT
jgi:hypothetical protein